MIPPKETNKTLRTDPQEREIYELSDKDFRITVLKKFSELQENTDDQMKLGKQFMNKMRSLVKNRNH